MAIVESCGEWESIVWPYPRLHIIDRYAVGIASVSDWLDCLGSSGGDSGIALFTFENDGTDWVGTPRVFLGAQANITHIDYAIFGKTLVVSVFERDNNVAKTFYLLEGFSPSNANLFSNLGYPSGTCVCNYKGRLMIGGISSGHFPWSSLGWNSVVWAAPGSLQFNPRANAGAGYIDLPYGNSNTTNYMYALRRLGNLVIAYSRAGVCILKPFQTEIAVGFGVEETSQPGTLNGGMIGGDYHTHLYIDYTGTSWLVTGNGEFKRLGYKEFFSPMVSRLSISNPILISFVPGRKRFYISDGTDAYVLTEWGLYESHQRTTGVGLFNNALVGFFTNNLDYSWSLKTNRLDFGLRALKTLETVEVGGVYNSLEATTSGGSLVTLGDGSYVTIGSTGKYIILGAGTVTTTNRSMSVSTEVKNDYRQTSFTSVNTKRLNPTGFTFPQATATEFKIKVSGNEYRSAEVKLEYISMGVKLVDKRGIRRIYGNTR